VSLCLCLYLSGGRENEMSEAELTRLSQLQHEQLKEVSITAQHTSPLRCTALHC
jgi:hypothetical protein